jgi:hypothetical protein
MPSLDDFLYENDELTLSNLIRSDRSAEAATYVARYPAIMHRADVMNRAAPLQVGEAPISLQIGENPRQRLIVNPDRYGYQAATYNGARHIFSQNKREWKAAIHYAAEKGMTDVVRLLIAKANKSGLADYINIKDAYGRTPLHYAAIGGHEETMQYLVRAGADPMESEANSSQLPWEMMDRARAYSPATMQLMSATFAAPEVRTALETNPLYNAILTNDEKAAKNLAFDERFFTNREALVTRARENGNDNLANYLSFVGGLHALRGNHHASLMRTHATQEAKDATYLELLKNSLDLLARHNPDDATQQYNASATMELMRVTSAIVNNISYDFRGNSQNVVPWQNLESLMFSVGAIKRDGNLKLLFQRELNNIHTSFSALRGNLNALNRDGTINAATPVAEAAQLRPILLITDLISDLRSLEKIASFIDVVDSIDTATPMSEGRLALLAMTKQLGEFSKHSQQCSNLSVVAKRHFQDIPWKVLEELRNHIAKAPERPKTHPTYDDILQNVDDAMLLKVRADVADISTQARAAHSAMMKQIADNGWDEITASYYRGESISDLSEDQKKELIGDLNAELASTTSRKQREKRAKIIQDAQAYLDPTAANADITNYTQLQSKIFGNFFKVAGDPNKTKWTNIFRGISGVFSGLEACYDRFEGSAPAAINYPARANASLDRMMNLVIVDPAIIDQLKADHNLSSQPLATQQHLLARLEAYDSSTKLRLAVEQLYSELWLVTNHMGAAIEMNGGNTKMRNFIEHRNNIYDAADRNLDRANFLEFVGAMFETHDKLVDAGHRPPGAIPRPVGAARAVGADPTILLGM